MRIVFVIFALSSLINISFLYKLSNKLFHTEEEFAPDEPEEQKSYAFDIVFCSSYFAVANSAMEFIQVCVFLCVVIKVDQKLKEKQKEEQK